MGDKFFSTIAQLQTEFYAKNNKNWIFKNKQKIDCASTVATQLSIEELMQRTVYIVPNTNHVYFDYTVFKLYATPENYEYVVNRIINAFQWCIDTYGSYQAHLNLQSFTISACERYKTVIEIYYTKCLSAETTFAAKMDKMYIYHTPSAIDTITRMLSSFIEVGVRNRMILYNKHESPDKVNVLLAGVSSESSSK